jgi:hypothetical protein
MGSCHGSKKTSNEIANHDENLEIYSLIWLDNTPQKSHKIVSILQQFRMSINYLKTYENEIECEEYIKQISKDEYVILIVNDKIGEKIISNIHNLPQIYSIYIYSSNKNTEQPWINQFNKVEVNMMNSMKKRILIL